MSDTSEPASPQALMMRAKGGDKTAFDELHLCYFLPVFRYLRKRLRQREDAEDLAQTVFLKIYTSEAAFHDKQIDPLAYLLTVAKHALIDYWRTRPSEQHISIEEDRLPLPQHSQADLLHNRQEVDRALRQLSPEESHILRQKFLEGYETADIAQTLNKSEAAIRQIQCRALRKLRAHISSYSSF